MLRISPAEVGCGRPYFLSYSARVQTEKPEHAALLADFITRYQSTCRALYSLVRRLFQNSKNDLALYAIFLPSKVPETIQRTWFWAENVTGHVLDVQARFDKRGRKWGDPARSGAKPKVWADLNIDSTADLLTVLANPNGALPSIRAGRVFQKMIAEYGLTSAGLKPNSIQWIFRHVPGAEVRRRIADSVATLVRGFLSSYEFARERARKRQEILDQLEAAHPAFFKELRLYVDDFRVWQRACRSVEELRKRKREELLASGLNEDAASHVLSAVQRAAMRSLSARIKAFAQIRPPTQDEIKLSSEHGRTVEEFVANLTPDDEDAQFGEDVFRCFASRNAPPVRLASNAAHLQRIIELYDQHVAPLSEPLKAVLMQRKLFGRRLLHTGWEKICRSAGRPSGQDMVVRAPDATNLYTT